MHKFGLWTFLTVRELESPSSFKDVTSIVSIVLLFFLGVIFGAIIVFLAIYPIIKDMFNYILDMNKIFKDKENKTNGEN